MREDESFKTKKKQQISVYTSREEDLVYLDPYKVYFCFTITSQSLLACRNDASLDSRLVKFMNSSCRIDVITSGGYLNKLVNGNVSGEFVSGLLDMVAFHADIFHSEDIASSFFADYYDKKVFPWV